jgi:cell wall-associated NlpC family hydrolase
LIQRRQRQRVACIGALNPAIIQRFLLLKKSDKWKAERLIAVAASTIGYGYHHHHIPDWNPAREWYEKLSDFEKLESNLDEYVGQGIDCSDYTSWLYNYGLGIYLITNIHSQGHMEKVKASDGTEYFVRRVADASMEYATLCKTLQTGDLLYIAGSPELSKADIQQDLQQQKTPTITHVIMWLGDVGFSEKSIPLVTDSHGSQVPDENDRLIPNGIQVRPFYNATVTPTTRTTEKSQSWYFDRFVWALRILPTF